MTQFEMMTSTRVVGERNVLDLALQEFGVGDARTALVFASQREHLVGHVEAVGFAGGSHAPCREQNIDAAARTEVKHGFSGAEFD